MTDVEITVQCNDAMQLYVIKAGVGMSTLGYSYAEDMRRRLMMWAGIDLGANDDMKIGTPLHFAAYKAAHELAKLRHVSTGEQCPVLLTPQLVGKEGCRVEVVGENLRTRFWVGKSSGWMPCHLMMKRRTSKAGDPVHIVAEDKVVVLENPTGRRR